FESRMAIAAAYRQTLDIPVVGVSGSVGKTSTKEMIATVLAQKFCVQKTAGNFNNELGMPLTLLSIRPEHEAAVVEMGINHFGEMDRLFNGCRPDLFVITAIAACHLEFLGDLDGVLKAKTEGLKYMKSGAPLVLNADDDKLYSLKGRVDQRIVFHSISGNNEAAVRAQDIRELGEEGSEFTLCLGCGESEGGMTQAQGPSAVRTGVRLSIPGAHMISNALAAAAVGRELGLDIDEIVAGLEAARTEQGRSTFVKVGDMTVIDDCYNANPASMKASIGVLASCPGVRIAVLGDMGELGENERALHAEVGARLAASGVDAAFLSGELSEEIFKEAEYAVSHVVYLQDTDEMTAALTEYLGRDDVRSRRPYVLVKASHFMGYERVVEALKGME
ncbi:MAG: UDP-N-acetylmuramoyl-tripeptide--D-alanyl-D-alanine ligase, partial [Eubacterium sp.]|nr:UDP-N-acetylmuramoyl-tripeptide--D-alanyl-D-alanine ligase [Eubacterium sp.]